MSETTRDAVLAHVAAFNAHDTAALLAGLADDARWSTGTDVVQGRAALEDLFDPWLWSLGPELELRRLIADGDGAAAQLVERITVDGERHELWIAAFFRVVGGLITDVKIYREGTADLDGSPQAGGANEAR